MNHGARVSAVGEKGELWTQDSDEERQACVGCSLADCWEYS